MRYTISKPTLFMGAMTRVPKRWVAMAQVRSDLNIRNGAFWTAVQSGAAGAERVKDRIKLYWEDDKYVYLPRHYDIPYLEHGVMALAFGKVKYAQTGDGVDFDTPLATGIRLRDKIQEDASLSLDKPGDKLLALSCGKGKTVIALHAAARSTDRFPVLVVVNTNALLTQWIREIEKFYSMPRRLIGHVQQDVIKWEGCPIAVGMLHTLVKRRYPKKFYRNWRTIIFDEAHRLGTEHFVEACSLFPGERWGLSATLKRDDGMDKLIRLHMGEVAYENLSQPLSPKVFFIKTGLNVDERRFRFRRGKVNMGKLATEIAMNEPRNKLILYWLERAARSGRKVLILGERLAQLNELYQAAHIPSKALHVGSMDANSRERALEAQVVFATQHLAKEGLDVPTLDTLFVLQPFGGEGRLRQSIGRILRIVAGKKLPTVMVFEDDIGIMLALSEKMRRHLRRLGWKYKVVGRNGNAVAKGNSRRHNVERKGRVRGFGQRQFAY